MARPTTKDTLIVAANGEFDKLWKLIASMPEEKQHAEFSFEDRDRNLRDVLVHLYEWHQLLLKWVNANKDGKAANFLPELYNWKTYPQMNVGQLLCFGNIQPLRLGNEKDKTAYQKLKKHPHGSTNVIKNPRHIPLERSIKSHPRRNNLPRTGVIPHYNHQRRVRPDSRMAILQRRQSLALQSRV
jgi:hypothetical protein